MSRDLSMTTGSIYDCMMQCERMKEKLARDLQEVNEDTDLNISGKQKRADAIKEVFQKKYNDLKKDMLEYVDEMKQATIGTPYEYSADLEHSIDFVKTMGEANLLTDAMFRHEMDKYRGNEMAYAFAREKLKSVIPAERFDGYAFSSYGDYDVNGKRQFVPPQKHFDDLARFIEEDNEIMTAHMMEQTENKLGIESVGRQNYREQQKAKLQTMTENTPQLI